jgi:PAS domain S-box-containing protein
MSNEQIKVLLIEDDPGDADLLRDMLCEGNAPSFDLVYAEQLSAGLERLATGNVDVVLLDLCLPDSQGYDTVARARAQATNVPIVVLTGLADEALAMKAVREGVQDYLVKGSMNGHMLARTMRYAIERKRAEVAIRQSQQNYEQLINSIDGIVWEADAQTWKFSFVSKQAERLLGYPLQRWLTEPTFWATHIHPDDRVGAITYCAEAIEEKRDHEFVYRMMAADGRKVWLRDIVTVVVENDQPVKLRGVMVDMTEGKRVEEVLEWLRRQNELILNAAAEGICGSDLQGNITFANPAAARMIGWEIEEMIRQPMHAILHHSKPDGTPYPESECPIYAVFKDGAVHRMDSQVFWRKDGTSFPVEYVSTPIREGGKLVGAVVTFKGLTVKRQTERLAMLSRLAAGVAELGMSRSKEKNMHKGYPQKDSVSGT